MKNIPRMKAMHDSDLSDIKSTLAHHDASIDDLGRRMHGVERGMHNLQGEVSKGFSDIKTAITSIESSRGPGFGRIAGVTAAVLTCVAFLCAGLFWLVSSTMAPDVAKIAKLDSDREEEFRRLREESDWKAEKRLRNIEDRLDWAPEEVIRIK